MQICQEKSGMVRIWPSKISLGTIKHHKTMEATTSCKTETLATMMQSKQMPNHFYMLCNSKGLAYVAKERCKMMTKQRR
jgi:hypothetical protein